MRYGTYQILAVFTGLLVLNLYAFYCFQTDIWPAFPNRLNVLSGIAVGEVCLIAIWLATRQKRDVLTLVIPAVGVVMASYLRLQVGFFSACSRCWTSLSKCAASARTARDPLAASRSNMWRWLTDDPIPRRLGYSIADILAWMTCMAVLAILLREATWTEGQPVALTRSFGLFAPGLLAILVFFVHLLPIHCFLRLLIQVFCGAMCGYWLAELGGNPFLIKVLRAEFATQAAVVGIGLELAGATALHSRAQPTE